MTAKGLKAQFAVLCKSCVANMTLRQRGKMLQAQAISAQQVIGKSDSVGLWREII
jgi:hypothetical protein